MRSSIGNFFLVASTLYGANAYTVSPPNERPAAAAHKDSRRSALAKLLGGAAVFGMPPIALADVDVSTVEMKEFVDPYGLFSINVPAGFFTLRRKAKGDLPDEKTGKGRCR